jgi:hypothetical protein
MTSKLLYKFSATLMVILSIGSMIGCTPLTLAPTSESLATATLAACQPSRMQKSKNDFPEIQGSMSTDGEMWALLFFDKAHAKEEAKIVWRITGSGKQFIVQGRHEDGTVISPIWVADHGGSNWDRPGYEWGTGFNFPKPGCWTLIATRGTTIGEIRLDVLPP